MAAQDTSKVKEKIFQFLKNNGPSLPIPISRNIKVDSLFTSAFLSELLSNQIIKITNMKVGSSPVYYAPGTEAGLEKYSEYLKSKEKEAYNLLKDNQFLEDEIQHPAIRVALRAIKDFAKYFKRDDKWIWRYFLSKEEDYQNPQIISNAQSTTPTDTEEPKTEPKIEVNSYSDIEPSPKTGFPKSLIKDVKQTLHPEEEKEKPKEPKEEPEVPKKEEVKIEKEPEEEPKLNPILPQTKKPKELTRISPQPTQQTSTFINPLAKKEEIKKPKEKPKSAFCIKVIEFIVDQEWQILQEIDHKAKEYNCLIQINSDLGPIIFKTQAKDKKTISEADMSKLLGEAQAIPLPALILSPGEPQKKAVAFLDNYTSVLKFKKIE